MQFFPHFLGFICFSQHSVLTHPHSTSSFDIGSQVAHPYKSKARILDLEANIFSDKKSGNEINK